MTTDSEAIVFRIQEPKCCSIEPSLNVARAFGGASLKTPVDYFADKTVGGSPFTILFAHSMEFV